MRPEKFTINAFRDNEFCETTAFFIGRPYRNLSAFMIFRATGFYFTVISQRLDAVYDTMIRSRISRRVGNRRALSMTEITGHAQLETNL